MAYEKKVANIANGERFETYAIPAPAGSGMIFNGAAAHKGSEGDLLVIMSFADMDYKEVDMCGSHKSWCSQIVIS